MKTRIAAGVVTLAAVVGLIFLPLRHVNAQSPMRFIGTVTTSSSVVAANVTGFTQAVVTVNGTHSGITLNFEFSDDNTTFYSTTCSRTDTPTQEASEAVATNGTVSWWCPVPAAAVFRVRSSAFTSGTMNVGITMSGFPPSVIPMLTNAGNLKITGAGLTGGANALSVIFTPSTNANQAIASVFFNTAVTSSVQVGSVALHNLYGFAVVSGATANCWLQFQSGSGTALGTNVIASFPLPNAGQLIVAPGPVAIANAIGGLNVGVATTSNGAAACATAASVAIYFN